MKEVNGYYCLFTSRRWHEDEIVDDKGNVLGVANRGTQIIEREIKEDKYIFEKDLEFERLNLNDGVVFHPEVIDDEIKFTIEEGKWGAVAIVKICADIAVYPIDSNFMSKGSTKTDDIIVKTAAEDGVFLEVISHCGEYTTQIIKDKAPNLVFTENEDQCIEVDQDTVFGNELQDVARQMGHDMPVNRRFYFFQDDVIELAKIANLLLAVENGKTHQFIGVSLDDLDFNDIPDEGSVEDTVDITAVTEIPM